jgi:phosphatidylglycerophosphatase A
MNLKTTAKIMSLSPLPRRRIDAALLIATWFGCGYAPVGPGTAGSLAALVIAIALNLTYGSGRGTFLLLTAIFLLPGVWAAGVFAKRIGQKDPQVVVVDEVLGQWLTLVGAATLNWKSWLAAFVLFRLFDIWKPPPARQLEALPGGIGIVADDLMAGLYGALAIFLLDRFQLF